MPVNPTGNNLKFPEKGSPMTKTLPPITNDEKALILPFIKECFGGPVDLENGFIYYKQPGKQNAYPVGHYGIATVPDFYNMIYASDVTGDSDALIVALERNLK
jgi:hypothetical protein